MSDKPRIWVDFMKTDDDRRIILSATGTLKDLERQGIELREGLTLMVYSDDTDTADQPDDLLAEGVVHRDAKKDRWVLEIDWNAVRHKSESDRRA